MCFPIKLFFNGVSLFGDLCRVCELEGKVRELESSMARMGAQHDVNMELIATFRHQKETVSASPIARLF